MLNNLMPWVQAVALGHRPVLAVYGERTHTPPCAVLLASVAAGVGGCYRGAHDGSDGRQWRAVVPPAVCPSRVPFRSQDPLQFCSKPSLPPSLWLSIPCRHRLRYPRRHLRAGLHPCHGPGCVLCRAVRAVVALRNWGLGARDSGHVERCWLHLHPPPVFATTAARTFVFTLFRLRPLCQARATWRL